MVSCHKHTARKRTWAKMLFVCYINDMPDVVDSPIHMFTDDTKIFRQMIAQSDQDDED